MLSEITEYLYSFNDYNWHELNSFLLDKFKDVGLSTIRENISILVIDKRIDVYDDAHYKIGLHSRINENDYQNTFRDLTNLTIEAKLKPKEKERIFQSKSILPTVNIIGDGNAVIQKSHLDNALVSPTIHKISNTTPSAPKKSPIEILSWIVGIIAGIILIYEFLIKK